MCVCVYSMYLCTSKRWIFTLLRACYVIIFDSDSLQHFLLLIFFVCSGRSVCCSLFSIKFHFLVAVPNITIAPLREISFVAFALFLCFLIWKFCQIVNIFSPETFHFYFVCMRTPKVGKSHIISFSAVANMSSLLSRHFSLFEYFLSDERKNEIQKYENFPLSCRGSLLSV